MQSPEEITSVIENRIQSKKTDSLYGHLQTVLQCDPHKLNGIVTTNQFKIWKFSMWSGVFYPVICGNFTNSEHRLNINIRMNILGSIASLLILTLFGYAVISEVIIQENNSFEFLWKRIIIGGLILSIPSLFIWIVYDFERKKSRKMIEKLLNRNLFL